MAKTTTELELKSVFDLLGEHFYIPHYQRGYRWTSEQVEQLLEDVWEFAEKDRKKDEFYCLQPIVVKPKCWIEDGKSISGFEVIDGQQRLTTIYLIIQYFMNDLLKVKSLKEYYGKEKFSLRYETREGSEEYLDNITEEKSKENIDYYHIFNAYFAIKEWFLESGKVDTITKKDKFRNTFLGEKSDNGSVQVIWYNSDGQENASEKESIELFTRLNMGKIPLTNAELVKALFLSESSFAKVHKDEATRRKLEISQMWDMMEQALGDDSFWAFITNKKKEHFPTKIELLLDFIAKKEGHERDPLHTFLFFLEESKNKDCDLWDVWLKIEKYYQILLEWQKDRELYHKVGYLIAVGKNARVLIEESQKSLKGEFGAYLKQAIKDAIDNCSYDDVLNYRYHKKNDYKKIENLLLLFNVETIRTNKKISEFYPFKFHKGVDGWSLEHIHAQNSEFLDQTKKEQWTSWIKNHLPLLKELLNEKENTELKQLIQDLEAFLALTERDSKKGSWTEFSVLADKALAYFKREDEDDEESLHSIKNLALLGQADNSALNNSTFELKRRKIIEMDYEGNYVPICTKRVFLKYFEKQHLAQQFYFWGTRERDNYSDAIKAVLDPYLTEKEIENGN